MARSALFGRLRSLASRARLQRAADAGGAAGGVRITRRELIEASVLTAAGLAACGIDHRSDHRVAVIGAGLAGLHCAYRLQQAGMHVSVYEASDRAGGRTWTARGMFPDAQVCELGGELIDGDHRVIQALVAELGLQLDDRSSGVPEGYAADTWFVAGVRVPETSVVAQFSKVAGAMAADMTAADHDDAVFARLDHTPLSTWIAQRVPAADYPELNAILINAYRGEFGLECEQQSALNLIYLIGSDDPEPFRIFGKSDERYHVHGGNDLIASGIRDRIASRIEYDARLVAAADAGDGFELRFARKNGSGFSARVERVVFALPFSTLRKVDLERLTLSAHKRAMIAELGYGTNAKVMAAFRSRLWRTQHNASGSVTTDLPFQQTWDTSIGQAGEHGLLTNFLGGEQGERSKQGTAEQWFAGILPDLERVFPGIAGEYVPDSAVRMHWPSYAHARGSYTCYRPGQWSFWGSEGLPEGKLHFCGEHTSANFQGWMEGAAETGAVVAAQILGAHGLPLPRALEALIDDGAPAQQTLFAPFPRRLLRTRAQASIRA